MTEGRTRHPIADVVFSVLGAEEATHELALAAYFLEEKEASPKASEVIHRRMIEAVPHLKRFGAALEEVRGRDELVSDDPRFPDTRQACAERVS